MEAVGSDKSFIALHDLLSGGEDARACRVISESACREQPRNFGIHLVSLSLTKIGDGLADAKLVLSWLLDALGAPRLAVAMLVPVRESLALLPQRAVAGWMRRRGGRKWCGVGGSAVQGTMLLAMAVIAGYFDGALAGWAIVGLLAAFSLARGVTLIGVVLLFGGGVGALADAAGPAVAVAVFAVLAGLGGLACLTLEEAQS